MHFGIVLATLLALSFFCVVILINFPRIPKSVSLTDETSLIQTKEIVKDDLPLWETLSVKTLLTRGKYATIEEHTVKGNGHVIPDWTFIDLPDFVNAVVITSEGEWLIFHQTKYAIGREFKQSTLATVGGYVDEGELPLEAAIREVKEETGYVSEKWLSMGTGVVDTNRECGRAHFFLALDAKKMGNVKINNLYDLERQDLLRLTTEQVEKALFDGEFRGISYQAVISTALLYKRIHAP